ncbi:hypothetical protein ACOI1H_23225 [Loktanella sp. DJP18]|uniref:hypothetical protein n=1 Tax=Loktanella sp. DJP18 TaxID=3409788 RepID=UPI003BB6B167
MFNPVLITSALCLLAVLFYVRSVTKRLPKPEITDARTTVRTSRSTISSSARRDDDMHPGMPGWIGPGLASTLSLRSDAAPHKHAVITPPMTLHASAA